MKNVHWELILTLFLQLCTKYIRFKKYSGSKARDERRNSLESVHLFYTTITKIRVHREIAVKHPDAKFHENPFGGFRDVACSLSHTAKLIYALVEISVPKAPKIYQNISADFLFVGRSNSEITRGFCLCPRISLLFSEGSGTGTGPYPVHRVLSNGSQKTQLSEINH
jgi:hypothetical protein